MADATYVDRQARIGDAREVLRLMESNSLSARLAAARLLETMGPDLVRSLLLLARDAEAREQARKAVYGLACAAAIVLLWVTGIGILSDPENDASATKLLLSVVMMVVAGVAAAPQYVPVAAALERLGDVRVVGLVAEALEMADTRWAAEETLTRLLPKLRASDEPLLNAEQRLCICRALATGSPRFMLAALRALEQVGGEAEIPFVERVAAGETHAGHYAEVRAAAGECLAYLRAAGERERARRRLLRPAEAPADALLRPARTAGPPVEQMVRPYPPEDAP